MAALMLTMMIAVGLGICGPLDLSRIEKWQTLTGSILAICGVVLTAVIAVGNVKRQIRVNVLSREEDRIERSLPGLREAEYFAGGFLTYRVSQAFWGITEVFQKDGFGVRGSTFQKDVQTALPNTDGASRRSVEQRLYKCFDWARIAENAYRAMRAGNEQTSNQDEWEPSALEGKLAEIEGQRQLFLQARGQFGVAMDELEAEIHRIRAKIDLYEDRSRRIRQELEEYFGKDI